MSDRLVGDLLDLFENVFEFILGDIGCFLCFFGDFICIAADVSNGDSGFFRASFDLFSESDAAFLGERRNREADDASVADGRDAEVGFPDRFFDDFDKALVPGLNGDQAGFRSGEISNVAESGFCPLVIDCDVFHQCGGGFSGADGGNVRLHRIFGIHHAFFRRRRCASCQQSGLL